VAEARRPYLTALAALPYMNSSEPDQVLADIVLTVALASLRTESNGNKINKMLPPCQPVRSYC